MTLITRTDRLTDDLHALAERVARMEGALAVLPWRPANGTPAPGTRYAPGNRTMNPRRDFGS